MAAPSRNALAVVFAPTKRTNGRSLDQQWNDLVTFLRGPGSALVRWVAVGQMHIVYKEMKRHEASDPERLESLTMRHFVERAMKATGVSRPTIYRFVEHSRALVETLGPAMLKTMLAGDQPIANDESILLKVAQLSASKAQKIVQIYMRGGKSEAAAARLVEKYLHEHQLSELTSTHEPKLRGGSIVNGAISVGSEKLDERNVVHFGDALLHLKETIPAESVQTCVTSPPFFAQRDFGTRHWFGGDPNCKHDRKVAHPPFHAGQVPQTKYKTPRASQEGQTAVTHSCSKCGAWYGQLGQESDLAMYLGHLVQVFREARRVLRPDGVCWIEIGDTYNSGTNAPSPDSGGTDVGNWQSRARTGRRRCDVPSLAAKSLLLVPQRLAVALQEDGWIVRSVVIVHKLAPLPESCADRPTRSHTTILMLSKSPDYFYDQRAIMEQATGVTHSRGTPASRGKPRKWAGYTQVATQGVVVRNCRDVWSLPVGKFAGAHTATFPPALPERCIRASTSEKGACASCGAPWRRVHAQTGLAVNHKQVTKYKVGRMRAGRLGVPRNAIPPPTTIGWEPTCGCGTSETVPCIVLEPFAGSGTTLMVAKQLKRDYIGIEINEREYRPLIERRLTDAGRPREQRTRRTARTSAGDS